MVTNKECFYLTLQNYGFFLRENCKNETLEVKFVTLCNMFHF